MLTGFDVIHGLRTVYPIAIAEAGTFEPELFERTAKMAARESRAHGINWNFAPMIDVARDSRWGRVSEGPGEDPYLASVFARAKIRGLQNDTSDVANYVAACLKHYVAYGDVIPEEIIIRQVCLFPSFTMCICRHLRQQWKKARQRQWQRSMIWMVFRVQSIPIHFVLF